MGESEDARTSIGPIALAGGGTGGHVVPGLHWIDRLVARGTPPADVLWFGAGRAIEDRVLAGLEDVLGDVPVERISLGLEPEGGGAPSLFGLALRTPGAVLRARRALRRHASRALVGLGGYTSLPAALAARSLGLPVFLLEINAVGGRATRWIAPLATRVFHAWPTTLPEGTQGTSSRHVHTGPPLARAFLAGAPGEAEVRAARRTLGLDPESPVLLILGGSQGALGLNRFVLAQAERLTADGLQVLHQVGPGRLAEGAPPRAGLHTREYLEDVAGALAAATLVLSRGGASTLAEIAARGRPVVVVPYPHHADAHQEGNARLLGEGARLVDESRLDASFADELVRLAGSEGAAERAAMERALVGVVPTDASERLAAELARCVGPR